MNSEVLMEEYMKLLESRDGDACKKFAEEHFGVEGTEDFKADEYVEFAAAVAKKVIENNRAVAEDEKTEAEVAEVAEEVVAKEVAKDEAVAE